jgi:hypothetical protein
MNAGNGIDLFEIRIAPELRKKLQRLGFFPGFEGSISIIGAVGCIREEMRIILSGATFQGGTIESGGNESLAMPDTILWVGIPPTPNKTAVYREVPVIVTVDVVTINAARAGSVEGL